MTDRHPTEGGVRRAEDLSPASPRRLFSDRPVKTPSRYRSFLLSTLFTFGGDR